MTKEVKDKIFMGPAIGEGTHSFVRVKQDEKGLEVSAGTATMSEKPIEGNSFAELKHLEGNTFEVKREIKFTASGPAQVSSNAYRKGWDGIFGKKTVGQA